jgi:hypothetical protein
MRQNRQFVGENIFEIILTYTTDTERCSSTNILLGENCPIFSFKSLGGFLPKNSMWRLIPFFTLQVWNATTGKCLKTLVGHTGGVWSSQMEGTTEKCFRGIVGGGCGTHNLSLISL